MFFLFQIVLLPRLPDKIQKNQTLFLSWMIVHLGMLFDTLERTIFQLWTLA